MSERLEAEIIAKDSATPVFRRVADGAERLEREFGDLDRSLEETERASRETGRAVEDLGRDVEEAGRAADQYRDRLTAAGAVLGTLASGLAIAGDAALQQSYQITALERAYGDASDQILQFTEDLSAATTFSDEATRQAAITASTLARNYGFTAEEIQRVLQISADLATTMGFSLEDATMRVTSALRGEAEAAEALGLTMNQTAIDAEGLTLTMNNVEAGHFRFNALLEQSAFAQGAAAERAETLAGRFQQLQNRVQDAATGFGQFLGPVGEIAAAMAPLALYLPVVGGAFGRMAPALTGAAGAMVPFAPALLAISAAAGTVGGSILLLTGRLKDEYTPATDDAVQATADLESTMAKLAAMDLLTGGVAAVFEQFADIDQQIETISAASDELTQIIADMGSAAMTSSSPMAAFFDNLDAGMKRVIGWESIIADGVVEIHELESALENLAFAQADAETAAQRWADVQDDLREIFLDTSEGGAIAREEVTRLTERLLDGRISFEYWADGVEASRDSINRWTVEVLQAAGAARDFAGLLGIIADNWNETSVEAARAESQFQSWAEKVHAFAGLDKDVEPVTEEVVELSNTLRGADNDAQQLAFNLQRSMGAAALSVQRGLGRLDRFPRESTEARHELVIAFDEAQAEQAQRVVEIQTRMIEGAFGQVTSAVTSTGEALDNTFRQIVGNTSAIGQQSAAVLKWSEELIAAEGTYSALDDLLNAGRISLLEYNAAQEAHNDIVRENGEIQEHVLAIQAQNAPMIAEMLAAQENYIQSLADRSDQEQLIALGWMDQSTAAQALELSMARLNGVSEATFANMVQGAVAANPVLGLMLEQMGLIELGADGEITITGAEESLSPMAELTDALEQLNNTLVSIFIDSNAEDVGEDVDALGVIIDSLPENKTTTFEGDGTGITNAAGEAVAAVNEVPEGRTVFIHGDGTGITGTVREVEDVLELVPWNPIVTIDGDEQDALDALGRAKRELELWDSSVGTATANLVDNASATLANISAHLNGLDGRSVTTYINTVQTFRGSSSSPLGGRQLGGVAGYADGGVIARMAEAGAELLHFPNGGVALAPHDGLYGVPRGTYVDTAPATRQTMERLGGDTFNVTITIDGAGDPARIADVIAADLLDAVQRRKRGMGWP